MRNSRAKLKDPRNRLTSSSVPSSRQGTMKISAEKAVPNPGPAPALVLASTSAPVLMPLTDRASNLTPQMSIQHAKRGLPKYWGRNLRRSSVSSHKVEHWTMLKGKPSHPWHQGQVERSKPAQHTPLIADPSPAVDVNSGTNCTDTQRTRATLGTEICTGTTPSLLLKLSYKSALPMEEMHSSSPFPGHILFASICEWPSPLRSMSGVAKSPEDLYKPQSPVCQEWH